jgi:hypothetical protein
LIPAKGEMLSWEGEFEGSIQAEDALDTLETTYFVRNESEQDALVPRILLMDYDATHDPSTFLRRID